MKGMLCCIFNFAPLYRKSIYEKIDSLFDTQFCFADEVIKGRGTCGIEQLDMTMFRRPVRKIHNRMLLGKHPWRSGIMTLPLIRRYSTFLITGDFNWAYLPFLFLCGLCGKKVYAWGHGLKSLDRYDWAKRLFYNKLDGYFFYSEGGSRLMQTAGYPSEKRHVIYNSLIDKVIPHQNEQLQSDIYLQHFGNSAPVLLFSGRLTSVKKVDMLLEAAKHVCANVIIIGEGPELNDLKKTADEIGIGSNVWFYGACYEEKKLSELFYNADLCVSPGNVGLLAVHAMQYGLPVVSQDDFATQMPEYEAIVEGRTGLLFKRESLPDLERAVKMWLDLMQDREAVRRNCYEIIERHWNSTSQANILKAVLK